MIDLVWHVPGSGETSPCVPLSENKEVSCLFDTCLLITHPTHLRYWTSRKRTLLASVAAWYHCLGPWACSDLAGSGRCYLAHQVAPGESETSWSGPHSGTSRTGGTAPGRLGGLQSGPSSLALGLGQNKNKAARLLQCTPLTTLSVQCQVEEKRECSRTWGKQEDQSPAGDFWFLKQSQHAQSRGPFPGLLVTAAAERPSCRLQLALLLQESTTGRVQWKQGRGILDRSSRWLFHCQREDDGEEKSCVARTTHILGNRWEVRDHSLFAPKPRLAYYMHGKVSQPPSTTSSFKWHHHG